jgi:phosphinothricin acetyltransferase
MDAGMGGDCSVAIRRAQAADAAAVAEIYNEAIATTTATFDTEPKSVNDRAAWLETHNRRYPVIVAESAGRVVGWASLSPWSERKAYSATGEVTYYVLADFRGHGIGRRLQDALIAEAKRQGFHTLVARITAGNDASVRLCETSGFEHIGTMKEVGHKFGQRLDVHIFQLMIGSEQNPD